MFNWKWSDGCTSQSWEEMHEQLEAERQAMQATVKRVEAYVSTLPHTTLVYTRLERELQEGRFMVAIERGRFSFDHKYIELSAINGD